MTSETLEPSDQQAPERDVALPAGFAVTAPPIGGRVLFDQHWMCLTLLHWPVEPAAIAQFFPDGTRPDEIGGVSYVGLVPFQMRGAGPGRSCPTPYFGTFAETNVRLYSVDEQGRRGILFRSLETQRLAIVGGTRTLLGLAYTWSQMTISRYGDVITYESRRRWPDRGRRCRVSVRIGDALRPSPIQTWLTARWGLHTRIAGKTLWLPNEHQAWPLRHAEILDVRDDLVAAAGIKPIGPQLPAMYSPGVRTQFGRPRLVKTGRAG